MDSPGLPHLSIIVPIHSGLESIANLSSWISETPTRGNIEVVAVLDGLNEEALQLILSKIEMGKPIKVVNAMCGNPGDARNLGLEKAKGEWISFWDSDDVGITTALLSELEKVGDGVELIVGHAEIVHSGETKLILGSNEREQVFNPGIWRYVFKRESLIGVRFPTLNSGEDQVFLARYRYLERKAVVSDQIFYRYYMGSGSQLTSNKEKIGDALSSAYLVAEATFLSRKWKAGYAVMSARLVTAYIRRGPGKLLQRIIQMFRFTLKFHLPSFFFILLKTWVLSTRKGLK